MSAKAVLSVTLGVMVQVTALPQSLTLAQSAWPIRPAARPLPQLPETPAARDLDTLQAQLKKIEAKEASVSSGFAFGRGVLRNPAQLPLEGVGYWAIRPERNAYFGTDDMVAGLIETCASLQRADPEMKPLAVGDISGPKGGRISLHLSHRTGRDADLLFFWMDANHRPIVTEDFVRFDAHGQGRYRGDKVLFDARRNWSLVRGLLTDSRFGNRVTRIFVSRPLRSRLLGYAATTEEDINIIRYARRVLQQPRSPAGLHDDHFHLRIGCSTRDAASGCRD